ncbi:MAG: helix-turn-helix domain-containing protein [Anaerolineae bacterium]
MFEGTSCAAHLPAADPTVAQINQIVDRISADRTITRVDDIADRLNISKRTLQRLFRQYVGVSPKWVIQHYRLHDAADQLANGESLDLSALALNLGYFDQAHFIKDFKAMVGSTPLEYAKLAGV